VHAHKDTSTLRVRAPFGSVGEYLYHPELTPAYGREDILLQFSDYLVEYRATIVG